ncbi:MULTISPECIES: S-layer homology domain-containing protein [unclassified Sedimentibacter]|uniref:S-layer homology domain-containing protein n=1 Tax=unclassified Sedimentibacter TaxID=2649220 RepID=UPI0027E08138|nr:S-layer homology domain-containing protein [Sedimentibacter sp. MB35-C1]WMJ77912.1 S-layer homology domain-containing protein [Sedimentibacter sp. MB35-C1]
MRKFLLIATILIIALSSLTTVYGQNFPDVSSDLQEAVSLLSGYGIIHGYPDGEFKPDKDVTRAEMAKIVMVAAGYSEYSKNMTSVYEDMHGHWAESYVELANVFNIVKGISPTTYGPDNKIKFSEAYTMIIRLLGYSDESLEGLWPSNYYKKAVELNLFQNIDTNKVYASRRDITLMIYNALECDLVKTKDNNTVSSTGKKLISNIGKEETKEISINDLKIENFDYTDYLFNKWNVYYDIDGNTIHLTNPRYNEFSGSVTSLLTNKVIFVTDDFGNVRAFQLPDIPIVINGAKSSFSNLSDSRIKVIYKDDSFNGDVIGIIAYKETDVAVIDRSSLYKEGSKSFAGKNLPLKSNGEINYSKLHISGDASTLEEIKANDVVYFYEAKDTYRGDSLTINVLRTQTEGVVTGIQTVDNSTFYTVNNISYKTGENFILTEQVSVNDNVELLLDKSNNIVKINILSYGKYPTTFGIVLSSSDSTNGNAAVKILDEFGSSKTYSLADNSSVVTIVEDENNLIKKTYLKKNDIVKFDPVSNETLKIINYVSSPTYIANNYTSGTQTLSNGYWITSDSFIVYEANGKYQLLEPYQLDTYLVGKAVIGYNGHIDVLYLSKGIKTESEITVTPEVPQTFNGTIYGIIKGVTKIDAATSHVQFFNNSNVFSVSNTSTAGKKTSLVLNAYVRAEITNGTITSIEKVASETDRVKITQIYTNQFLIDGITYMEYSPNLAVYICSTDKSGNITNVKIGLKENIKSGSTAQLYDLYGSFDGIIDVVLIFN